MNSSLSLLKPAARTSFRFRNVRAYDLFYQLTYMSAVSSAGITRSKTFELAAASKSPAADYFAAINTLVEEMRYSYPDACRSIGERSKDDDIKSFLLRLSDALRSGEPLPDYLAREAEVQAMNYQNQYERDLESLKQWSDAFSSIVVSVALIVIIQVVTSMIYSMDIKVMAGLVTTGIVMGFFGAWIISRAAPQERLTLKLGDGSAEQLQAFKLARILGPVTLIVSTLMLILGVHKGWVMIAAAVLIAPVGAVSLLSDSKTRKKDSEFSTFLRSAGGMASSAGTTLKQSLTLIDLSSFPTLKEDITRLSMRLQALVNPEICWDRFGHETGSQLIAETTNMFYSAIRLGGDPERVGYLCSLFAAKSAQLRAKRKLVSGTFTGLTLVMQGVVAGLMVFVLEIVYNFMAMIESVMDPTTSELAADTISMGMVSFTPEQLAFLTLMTVAMVVLLAIISSVAIYSSDGGYILKAAFYLSITFLICGIAFLIIPPMVASILTL